MKFKASNNIQISKGINSLTNHENETVIITEMNDSSLVYKIDGVAAEMWECFFQNKSNLGEVTELIAKKYDIGSNKVLKDSQEFLKKVHSLKFITVT